MTDRKLMQQALDALDSMNGTQFLCDAAHHPKKDRHEIGQQCPVAERYKATREAIRARLSQPEPVACHCDSPAWCNQYKKCHRAMLGFEPYVAPPQRELKNDE